NYFIKKLYDSKALNPNERKKIFNQLTTNPDIIWSIGIVENYEIDKLSAMISLKDSTYQIAELNVGQCLLKLPGIGVPIKIDIRLQNFNKKKNTKKKTTEKKRLDKH
ncbi:MAG: hypothetical protein QW594_01225, partial [Candidatus Woesearchaeota archaeon]